MKKFYTLIISLLACSSVFSKNIDRDYAMQVAKNFYFQNTGKQVTLSLVYECKNNNNIGSPTNAQAIYYVFDVAGNNGFVLISADDLVDPVLGYSTKGRYTLENLPPALIHWMDNYKKQIVFVKENRVATSDVVSKKWHDYYNNIPGEDNTRSVESVNPLVQTQWNQEPFYNDMCPFDNTQVQYCVTGCVACAMAQIMKYWNYPSQGTGYHSYNAPNYGTQSANFGSTTYAWSSMPASILSDNTAIETLMYHCGVAVEMNYGVDESSAFVLISQAQANGVADGASAEYAYKTYFGYDPSSVQGVLRTSYSDQDWINLLENELNNNRPVEYAGIGSGGGHTWVCDGYDQNNNFHMNWGWGGQDDGYFNLNSLDPSSLGTGGGTGGFNSDEQAVIGIKPSNSGGGGTTVNQDSIVLYAAITPSASTVPFGSQFSASTSIANAGSSSFTGDFAAALFNSDGVFNGFVQVYTSQTMQAGYYYNFTFTLDTIQVIPGIYYVGIYYRNGSNDYSLLMNPNNYTDPIQINVTGPYNVIQMYSNDTITPARPQVNQAFSATADIYNANSSNFTGYILAALYTLEGNYVTDIQTLSGTMLAGYYYHETFSTSGLNVAPGTYYIAFWSSPDNTNWTLVYDQSYPNPVEVTIVSEPLNPDAYEPDNSEGTAYVLPVNFTGNTADVNTAGSNINVGNDYDYYKIDLPAGTNYNVTARVDDSKSSGNGQTYTDDVVFSYKVNSGNWSSVYDDVLPGPIFVSNGGTVTFFVSDYFLGTIGTYLLDMQIESGVSGIEETQLNNLRLFPNPTNSILFIRADDIKGAYTLNIYNTLGELVSKTTGIADGQQLQTDVSNFAAGVYIMQIKTTAGVANSKFIVR